MIQMSYTVPWQLIWYEWIQSGGSGSRTPPLENHKICVDIQCTGTDHPRETMGPTDLTVARLRSVRPSVKYVDD